MIKCNLAVLLAERNLRISELSKRTGISRTTLTALSQNQSKGIQFDTFDTICNFLNIKPNDLFIQEKFDYDFEVTNIIEEYKINGPIHYFIEVNAEINYKNHSTKLDFTCYGDSWCMNNLEPTEITDVTFEYSPPKEMLEILYSIPITFKVSFEQELFDCLKAELIVKYNLDEEDRKSVV